MARLLPWPETPPYAFPGSFTSPSKCLTSSARRTTTIWSARRSPTSSSGQGGDDIINAGDGDDFASGGQGNDTIDLGDGFDQGIGNAGDDIIFGGEGNDHLYRRSPGRNRTRHYRQRPAVWRRRRRFHARRAGRRLHGRRHGLRSGQLFRRAREPFTSTCSIQGTAQNTGRRLGHARQCREHRPAATFADVLIGNHLANWIWSHGGADDITGNAGDDTFWIPQGDGAGRARRSGRRRHLLPRPRRWTARHGSRVISACLDSAQDIGRGFVTLPQHGRRGRVGVRRHHLRQRPGQSPVWLHRRRCRQRRSAATTSSTATRASAKSVRSRSTYNDPTVHRRRHAQWRRRRGRHLRQWRRRRRSMAARAPTPLSAAMGRRQHHRRRRRRPSSSMPARRNRAARASTHIVNGICNNTDVFDLPSA